MLSFSNFDIGFVAKVIQESTLPLRRVHYFLNKPEVLQSELIEGPLPHLGADALRDGVDGPLTGALVPDLHLDGVLVRHASVHLPRVAAKFSPLGKPHVTMATFEREQFLPS